MKVTIVKAAKDLGVICHAGVRRYAHVIRTRLTKAKQRSERIRTLVKVDNKASRLFSTGAYPQGTYGIVAQGYDPPTLQTLTAMAHRCVSSDAAGQCATTNIALTIGLKNHPGYRCPTEQVKS